jgi:hypothetical protein
MLDHKRDSADALPMFPSQRHARRLLMCGPKEIKDLIAAGRLETVAVGKRLRVTRRSLRKLSEQYG